MRWQVNRASSVILNYMTNYGWAEQSRGEAAWGGGSVVSASEAAQMGYKVVAKGNSDCRGESLGDWQRGFYSFQVRLSRALGSYFYTHNGKCVIGKKCRQHNGFATHSTERWSPNHRQALATLPARWSPHLSNGDLFQSKNIEGRSMWNGQQRVAPYPLAHSSPYCHVLTGPSE